MRAWGLGPDLDTPAGFPVSGCSRCGGAWLDAQTLAKLIDDAASHAWRSDQKPQASQIPQATKVVYRRCPACDDMMTRRNFAHVSGIIVDECRQHGTFFDAGELEAVLGFVRTGGLAAAAKFRAKERDRELAGKTAPVASESRGRSVVTGERRLFEDDDLVSSFVYWVAGWLTRLE